MNKLLIISLSVFLFVMALTADAATMTLLPSSRSFNIGQEFTVDIKINTEDAYINAAQATVKFPNDVLEMVTTEKVGSAFNFWVQEPAVSNDDGTVSFIAGTTKGISGGSLQVLKMKFKAKGAGTAEISLSEVVVTASDGKGTNVLSIMEGTSVAVGTQLVAPSAPPVPPTASESVILPQKVERRAVKAENLPEKPVLRAPLYPDQSRWYNHLGETIVLWDVPRDIIKVATALDQIPYTEPQNVADKLFTGEKLGILEEGVWYVHVQFKNDLGWGEVAHYKISIDTTAPFPFEIKIDNEVSDNPLPDIQYEANDSFSGISEYIIYVDGQELLRTESSAIALPAQKPSQHTLTVCATDKAGNSVEDDLEFEILPLPTPIIDFVTTKVSQGEVVFASGKTIPNGFVDIQIVNKNQQEVFRGSVNSDNSGNWEIIIEEALAKGNYGLTATARDERGAVSYSTQEEELKITAKVVLSLGFIDLGWLEIFVFAVLLVCAVGGIGAWYFVSTKKTRQAYKIIAGRDLEKLNNIMAADLKELNDWLKSSQPQLTPHARVEVEYFTGRIAENIAKIKKYLKQELNKLK